jgi:hypothetical protein
VTVEMSVQIAVLVDCDIAVVRLLDILVPEMLNTTEIKPLIDWVKVKLLLNCWGEYKF